MGATPVQRRIESKAFEIYRIDNSIRRSGEPRGLEAPRDRRRVPVCPFLWRQRMWAPVKDEVATKVKTNIQNKSLCS
jgi:hypothetical protein